MNSKTEITSIFKQLLNLHRKPETSSMSNCHALIKSLNKNPQEWNNYIHSIKEIKYKDIDFFNFLIANGADIKILLPYKNQLIQRSAEKAELIFLTWLVERCQFYIGRDPKQAINSLAQHPLIACITPAHQQVREYLIEKMLDHRCSCDTPLIIATHYSDIPLFHYLIEQKKHDINTPNINNETPLMFATAKHSRQTLELLLGLNVNALHRSKSGHNALHFAIVNGNILAVKKLLDHITTNHPTFELKSLKGLLHFTITYGQDLKLTQIILSLLFIHIDKHSLNAQGVNLAVFACISGKLDLAQWLINDHQLDVMHIDNDGMNALHLCILNDKKKEFQWLINEQKISTEVRTSEGLTPLLVAAAENDKWFINYLIKHEHVDITATDHKERSILHFLAIHNDWEKISYLIKHNKIDIHAKMQDQSTLLDIAIERSNNEIINGCIKLSQENSHIRLTQLIKSKNLKELLKFFCKNATLETPDTYRYIEDGQTPLHIACATKDRNIIQDLIKTFKLNINYRNAHLERPLALIINMQQPTLAKWFIEQFDPALTKLDAGSATAAYLACKQGLTELTIYCIEKDTSIINIQHPYADPVLNIAVTNNQLEIVKLIWNLLISKKPPEHQIKLCSPKVIEYIINNKIYTPSSVIYQTVTVDSVTVETTEPLPTIELNWILQQINENNLAALTALKTRSDLDDFFTQNAFTLAKYALQSIHHRMAVHILRIPNIYHNLEDQNDELANLCIQTKNMHKLKAFIKCRNTNLNHILCLAIAQQNEECVRLLLSYERIRLNAHLNNNQACLLACKSPMILMDLLELENVKLQVTLDTTDALLFELVKIGDVDNLITLLAIENIHTHLSKELLIKAYEMAKELQHEDIVELFMLFDDIKEHLQIPTDPTELAVTTNTSEIRLMNHVPIYVYVPYEIIPDQQMQWLPQPINLTPSIAIDVPIDNYTDDSFYNTLYDAVEGRQHELVRQLLMDSSVISREPTFYTHLCFMAIMHNDLAMLKLIFSNHIVYPQLTNKHKMLCLAIFHSDANIVSFLLQDPQISTQLAHRQAYVLRAAAQVGSFAIVDQLLAMNSIKTCDSFYKMSAFRKALSNKHKGIAFRLLEIPEVFQQAVFTNKPLHDDILLFIKNKLLAATCVDYTYEQFRLYRLILAYCIQKNDPYWNTQLNRWFATPIFRNSAHLSINNRAIHNESLQIAQMNNNKTAASILLTIEQVKQIAINQNFYKTQNPGLDLEKCLHEELNIQVNSATPRRDKFFLEEKPRSGAQNTKTTPPKTCC